MYKQTTTNRVYNYVLSTQDTTSTDNTSGKPTMRICIAKEFSTYIDQPVTMLGNIVVIYMILDKEPFIPRNMHST